MPIGDVTTIASVVAATTALVAAIAALTNLAITARRDRPLIVVSVREWSPDHLGVERYVRVIATNTGARPVSVVAMGVVLDAGGGRTWRRTDGTLDRGLPARLDDGEAIVMDWLRDELGPEYFDGQARIVACFAIDGRNKEVLGAPLG